MTTDIPDLKCSKWSIEEDKALRTAVEYYGEKNWIDIANEVGQKNPMQCFKRWSKILKPGLVKESWLPREDKILREWVEKEGTTDWSNCSLHLPGRSGKQCRERWFNILNPIIDKRKWTPEEDSIIFELHKRYGSNWSLIAKSLPGRADNSVKHRFYNTKKRLKHRFPAQTVNGKPSMDPIKPYLYYSSGNDQIFISKEKDSNPSL